MAPYICTVYCATGGPAHDDDRLSLTINQSNGTFTFCRKRECKTEAEVKKQAVTWGNRGGCGGRMRSKQSRCTVRTRSARAHGGDDLAMRRPVASEQRNYDRHEVEQCISLELLAHLGHLLRREEVAAVAERTAFPFSAKVYSYLGILLVHEGYSMCPRVCISPRPVQQHNA